MSRKIETVLRAFLSVALLLWLVAAARPAHAQDCSTECYNEYDKCLGQAGPEYCVVDILDPCLAACPANPEPPPGPTPEGGPQCSDPVDCGSGLFVNSAIDLLVKDTTPIRLKRVYRQVDTSSGAFGIGWANSYHYTLYVDQGGQFTYADLVLPDGGRVHYVRTSSGTDFWDAVFQDESTPSVFYGSTITWNSSALKWLLRMKNGTQMLFGNGSLLDSIEDRNGNTVSIQRNSNNEISQIISPNGRWLSFTYDSNNRVSQVEDNSGRTVSYTYDGSGRLSTVTDANGGVTTYGYDGSGLLATITTPRGNVKVTNQYDSNGRVVQQTHADGGVVNFSYTLDGNGNVTASQMTDADGNTHKFDFNSSHYVTSETWAQGTPEQQTYTFNRDPSTNLVLSETDGLGRTTAYSYDSLGDVTSVTRLYGTSQAATTSYTYDPTYNQLTSVTDPLGHTWAISRDAHGNPVEITDPLGHEVTLSFDSEGEVTGLTNGIGDTVHFSYNAGDLVSVTDPLGHATTRFFDAVGRLVGITDPLGNHTSLAYDPLDDLTSITNAMGGITSFAYDADRDLTSVTDADGNKTTYTYDPMDRLASRTDALNATQSYVYDGNGNLVQYTDRRGTVDTFSYDGLNRRTFAGFGKSGSTYQDTINYTWDAGNRLTQAVDALAGTVARTYDGLNRLTEEQTPQGDVTYAYDSANRRTSMMVAGQPTVNYTWDNANRLTQITQGSNTVGFIYDAANRRTTLTLPNGITVAYTYDNDSRVTGITYTGASELGNLTYSYDADGRRTAMGGSLAAVNLPAAVSGNTFNADNEMTGFDGTTLSYDANGNLTSDGTNSYTWDARNHLSGMSGSSTTASFVYGAFGRRVSKTINGATTQFLYDGLNPVQELDGANPPSVTANLLTGLGVDEYFARTDSSGTMAFLRDALGSTIGLVNSAGSIGTSYTYEPFGNTTVSGSSANAFQFTGRENDATGLYFYRARYYSPTFQRFVSQDPIGFNGGDTNLYGYASNDPVDYRDASGKLLIGGLLTAAACGAYDVYQHYSLLSDENALTNQLGVLRQQIQDLSNQENSCPNVNPEREQQIEELEQKAFNLAGQLAAAHASDVLHGLATTTICVGLTAVASSPLVPF